jgi:hypothetical protein
MPSLSDDGIKASFVEGCVAIWREWKVLGNARRRAEIEGLVRRAVTSISIQDFSYFWTEPTDHGAYSAEKLVLGAAGGVMRSTKSVWGLTINKGVSEEHDVTLERFKWFCTVLYHEARHGEQWFRMAQGCVHGVLSTANVSTYTAAGGKMTLAIWADQLHMPVETLRYAEQLGKVGYTQQVTAGLPIASWFGSVFGAHSAHRGTVLASPHIFTEGHQAKLDYLALPEEVDAYAVQNDVDARLTLALAGVAQTQAAQAQKVGALAGGHQSKITAVSAQKPAASGPVPGKLSALINAHNALIVQAGK